MSAKESNVTDETPTRPSMQAIIDSSRTTRDKDFVLYRALVLGYEQANSRVGYSGVITFAAFRSGVELALDYLGSHDRRTR
jgi:hypothetical protein